MIKVVDKRPRNMVNSFILFFVCLWRLVDVMDEVKSVSVMEGDSVTLNTGVTETQKYVLIQWTFENTRIAEVSRLTETNSTYDGPDERFRDRLNLDQTGSLTITNTSTTDSGLYKLTIISGETKYMSFNLTVYESARSTSSPERSTNSNFLSSSCAVNNLTFNHTEDANITDLCQPSSDHSHCCGFTETVIRLALSALVGVATVAFLVYDIRSTRSELNRMGETRYHRQTRGVKSDKKELSRRFSSRYVC